MPIEINELIVKAVVQTPQKPSSIEGDMSNTHEEKLQQILDKVLEQLKKKNER